MHQLLLLRHAKSSWDDAAMSDRERPLNARGRKAAAAMRTAMRDLGLVPDMVLVSTARRTIETLDALEPWDDTPLIEPMDDLYLAGAERILDAVRAVTETVRTVLVIGHNPGLHDLALTLTDGKLSAPKPLRDMAPGFPTAGLAEFSIAGPWERLGGGGGRLLRFLTPKMLNVTD